MLFVWVRNFQDAEGVLCQPASEFVPMIDEVGVNFLGESNEFSLIHILANMKFFSNNQS